MTLRTLRSVFLADRERRLGTAVCNGFVDAIDTATGQSVHWCLISVEVPRDLFDGLDLSRVDPMDCLTYLHAKVSRSPHRYHPVQPIIEYPWDDLPYADELDAAVFSGKRGCGRWPIVQRTAGCPQGRSSRNASTAVLDGDA